MFTVFLFVLVRIRGLLEGEASQRSKNCDQILLENQWIMYNVWFLKGTKPQLYKSVCFTLPLRASIYIWYNCSNDAQGFNACRQYTLVCTCEITFVRAQHPDSPKPEGESVLTLQYLACTLILKAHCWSLISFCRLLLFHDWQSKCWICAGSPSDHFQSIRPFKEKCILFFFMLPFTLCLTRTLFFCLCVCAELLLRYHTIFVWHVFIYFFKTALVLILSICFSLFFDGKLF